MKRNFSLFCLSSSLILSSSVAFAASYAKPKNTPAAETAPMATAPTASKSSLGELTYIQDVNTFLNSTSIDYSIEKYTLNSNPSQWTNYTFHTTSITDTLSYSFFKHQVLSLSLSYAEQAQRETSQNSSSSTNSASRGFSNPTIGYTIRLLEQEKERPFNLDFGATFSPSLIKSIYPESGNDGSISSGKNIFALNAAFSGKYNENFIWKLEPEIIYHGDKVTHSATTQTKVNTDNYFSYALAAQGQSPLNTKYYLNYELKYSFVPSTSFNINNRSSYNTGAYSVFGSKVGLTDVIVPEKIIGFVSVEAYFSTERDVTSGGVKQYTLKNQFAYGPTAGFSIVL